MFLKVLSSIPTMLGLKMPPERAASEAMIKELAALSRQPIFYTAYGVPDTIEGRFDMFSMHVFAALERVRAQGEGLSLLSQALFDAMTSNLDANFREMGVGDTRVGKKVRELVEVFYGQAKAYRAALEDEDTNSLTKALGRNVYGSEEAPQAAALADYLRRASQSQEQDAVDLAAGRIHFPASSVDQGESS